MNMYILMPFLYFPEDKTEYIPAVISLVIFMSLACVAMYVFYKKSKKDEEEFNKKYNEQLQRANKTIDEK
ncbi:hypothetical protein [Oceanobacillus sp. Castelsardo]|uniref:hypothetical protein n=1 Tax=Oceanobacillus sp. Castelsardo TaxID=1851204 RepID=UPI000B2F2517|nr:hypothetical protein [Oceanobacillus sp. Castelsardo]